MSYPQGVTTSGRGPVKCGEPGKKKKKKGSFEEEVLFFKCSINDWFQDFVRGEGHDHQSVVPIIGLLSPKTGHLLISGILAFTSPFMQQT